MQITREDLNPCTVKLDVVCSPDQVREGFAKAYKTLAKKVRVPGFRPGQAPRAMIEQMVSRDDIYNEAADAIVKNALTKAIEQEKLEPNDYPAVQVTKLDEADTVCEFTSKIPLAPIVELGDYKGLAASRPKVEVTDDEVEQQLDLLRQRAGKREEVKGRGVQAGDIAVVNIKAEGDEGEGRNFMTIAGKTFEQLDEAIQGMEVEEMKSLELKFPKNFQEKDWAGKTMKCQVTLRSLNAVKLPELDDAFAKSLKTDNVADLKDRLRDRMLAAKQQMADDYVNEQLQEELLKRCTVHVPDNMWESVAARRLQDLQTDIQAKGLTPQQYAEQSGMTMEQLVEAWRHEAKSHVMRAVVVRDIFVKEKLKLSNEDLNIALHEMAGEYEMPAEDLFMALKKNKGLRELEFRAIFKKVIGFLNEHAKVTPAA